MKDYDIYDFNKLKYHPFNIPSSILEFWENCLCYGKLTVAEFSPLDRTFKYAVSGWDEGDYDLTPLLDIYQNDSKQYFFETIGYSEDEFLSLIKMKQFM